MPQPAFLSKSLAEMTPAEWESLCDGCGLCCQIRVEDEDTGQRALSNVACRYLCLESHRCKDYANRQQNVPDCIKVTRKMSMNWTGCPTPAAIVLSGAAKNSLAGIILSVATPSACIYQALR